MDILFNENTLTAIFWTFLMFGILVTVLAIYAWPRILEALQEREKRIEETIQAADEKNKDAETTLARYQAQLEEARVDAQKIIEEGKKDAEALKQKHLQEQLKESEAMKRRALREIHLARDKALSELHKETVELSISIASRLIEKNLTAKDHKKLIEKALSEAESAAEEG
ncbi:MAG: F0F1 ATP synthase subunit B [Planctomycetota bacterium]|jgi:F-type H+-transporting ATPase subunit b